MTRICLWSCALLGIAASAACGQTSYPMVTQTYPVAVRRGTSSELTVFAAQSLAGASELLVEGAGLTAEALKPKEKQPPLQAQVRFTAAPDAPLGVREFRILTPAGLSSLGQVLVVDDPVVTEGADATSQQKAVKLAVPCVACGRIAAAEQTKWFRFDAMAGQSFTFEVVAARIEDKIHDLQKHLDPLLTLCDGEGRELAACDDFFFADPLLSWTCRKAGTYFLQVRDAKYDGDPRWVFALKASQRPAALAALPWALPPGAARTVRLIGPAGWTGEAEVRIPADADPGWRDCEVKTTGGPLVLPFFVAANAIELPPPGSEPEPLSPPQTVSGWLAPKQPRRFRFQAKRTQQLRFTVQARRFGTSLNSALDAVLEVFDAQGRSLIRVDDDSPAQKDATLAFIPPADGEYTLALKDLHGRGGPSCCFVLVAGTAEPDFDLKVDGDKAALRPGGSAAWHVQIERKNGHRRPVEISVEGLPAGVAASRLTLPPGMRQGVLVLTAAPDAEPAAAAVKVLGSELGGEAGKVRLAVPVSEIYLPGGGRGRFDVALHAVAVVPDADLREVQVEPAEITLRPGQEVALKVKIVRRPEAAKANVTLDVRLRHLGQVHGDPLPPGVILDEAKSKTLLGTDNEGTLVLRALPSAQPIKDWPICVTAHVSVNFVVKVGYASLPLPLTIEKP